MTRARLFASALALIVAPQAAAPFGSELSEDRAPSERPEGHSRTPSMTLDRLDALIRQVDASARREGPGWQLTVEGTIVQVIADADHDRMRILVPIAPATEVSDAALRRCLEANFSTALDARYAVAQDVLWSAFLHPLASLDEDLFLSGLGQTVTLARTYGTTFRSGILSFGGSSTEESPPERAVPESEL